MSDLAADIVTSLGNFRLGSGCDFSEPERVYDPWAARQEAQASRQILADEPQYEPGELTPVGRIDARVKARRQRTAAAGQRGNS